MNPFLLDKHARLQSWKQLRQQIASHNNTEGQIDLCLAFWRQAGLEKPIIDWDNCDHWPGPWDLLHQNRYCSSSHSLGIAYTLLLADPEEFDQLNLLLITDRTHSIQKIVCATHGFYLNHGFVDKTPQSQLQQVLIHNRWRWIERSWHLQ